MSDSTKCITNFLVCCLINTLGYLIYKYLTSILFDLLLLSFFIG